YDYTHHNCTHYDYTHHNCTHYDYTHHNCTHYDYTHHNCTHYDYTHNNCTHYDYTHHNCSYYNCTHYDYTHHNCTHYDYTHHNCTHYDYTHTTVVTTTAPTTTTPTTTTPTTTTPTTTAPTTTTPTTTAPTTTTPTTTVSTTTAPTTTAPTTTTPTTTAPTTTTPTTTAPTTTTPTTTVVTTTASTTTVLTTTAPTTTTPATTSTTLTTTTTTPTTTEPETLCPTETQPVSGQSADTEACAVAGGIVGIYDTVTGEIFCNGVLDSPTQLLVPSDCAEYFTAIFDIPGLEQIISIGGNKQEITLTSSNFNSTDRGDGVVEITLPEAAEVTDCPQYACTYEEETMAGLVDFTDCFYAGYGSTEANSNTYTGTLLTVSVQSPADDSCCDVMLYTLATSSDDSLTSTVASKTADSVCFDSVDSATCSADFGSPIYCKTTTTAEVVLVGLTTSSPCTAGNPLLSIDFTGGAISL
ncbi:hypothetical protein EGW08_016339, partial [Elysia chlorotica]